MKDLDQYRGCLIGGAVGDALGYPIEFMQESEIFRTYGAEGIQSYQLTNNLAEISDDTQMTMFTATGLLVGTTRGMTRGIMGSYPGYIMYSYRDWLRTQTEAYPLPENESHYSWLVTVPEMFSRRAPGITCLSAIENGRPGTIEKPLNHSKGCGGIMRVAPIGIYLDAVDGHDSYGEIQRIGAETAALTHGHELGYLPAAVFVHIISELAHDPDATIKKAVYDALETLQTEFADKKSVKTLSRLIDKAVKLSGEDIADLDAIHQLGAGWVAEETLAIAVYCSLKYSTDFKKAVVAAVNHGGDSDSTGAVTGNIVGTALGLSGIPSEFTTRLELKDIILMLADDLYHDCQITEYGGYNDPDWEHKYIENDYGVWKRLKYR
jgi:ADP-ribosylglycohydrolase